MFPATPAPIVGYLVRREAIQPDAYCLEHAPSVEMPVPLCARDQRLFRCVVCRKALTPRRLVLGPENLDDASDPQLIRGVKGQIAREMFSERAGEFLDVLKEYCS